MPIRRQRRRDQDHKGKFEGSELGDDEQVDAQDRYAEGRAHVAERDIGHLPFAVPKNCRFRIVERLPVKSDLRQPRGAPIRTGDRLVDREHPIDRGLVAPGHLGAHHFNEAAIVAIDREGRFLGR